MSATDPDRLARAEDSTSSASSRRPHAAARAARGAVPDDPRVAVLTAWTHDSLGLEEEAAEHYEAALANGLSGDDLRGALLGLGSTYRTLGRDEDSERIFRRGLEEFPDFRPYRVFRAMLQYNRGEAREAVQELIAVLLDDDQSEPRHTSSGTGALPSCSGARRPSTSTGAGSTGRDRARERRPRAPAGVDALDDAAACGGSSRLPPVVLDRESVDGASQRAVPRTGVPARNPRRTRHSPGLRRDRPGSHAEA